MSLHECLLYIQILACGAVLLQGLEMLLLKQSWSEGGVWRWSLLQREIKSEALRKILGALLNEQSFFMLLVLQVAVAFYSLFYVSGVLIFILWAISILTAWRFRGTFNGGSDTMTATVLGALMIARLSPENLLLMKIAVIYIAVQLTLSYEIAGVVKISQLGWRRGFFMTAFFKKSVYVTPKQFKFLFENKAVAMLMAWALIIFECTFSVVFLDSRLLWIYLPLGILFHLGNFLVFGLNRFFWIWMSCYPAVIYLSQGGL